MRRNDPIVTQTGHRRLRIADDMLGSSDQPETHFDSHIRGTRAHDHIAGAVIELIDDPSRIADLLHAACCADRSLRVQAGCDARMTCWPTRTGNADHPSAAARRMRRVRQLIAQKPAAPRRAA